MLPKQIVALFVRLFSIVFLIMALRSAASFVPYVESYGAGFPVVIVILTSMVPFLCFCATWFFPATIAGWLAGWKRFVIAERIPLVQ
ncbi:MAG: hypothetical protein AB8G16_00685 [Gammaproteobacteria bacterium]